jgi:8-oxo-dGTP pyrophosphatase MutT (NUDIX family)
MKFKDIITHYIPLDAQEVSDQKLMLQLLNSQDNLLDRNTLYAHVTSSVFIINPDKTKVLLGFHNIYQSWGWFGGHNDLDEDCKHVALKEAIEETGIHDFKFYSEECISIDCIYVGNHIKKGVYISDHLHLNVTYGLIAEDTVDFMHNEEEHQGLKWFDIDTFLDYVKEDRMKPIYTKILSRMLI